MKLSPRLSRALTAVVLLSILAGAAALRLGGLTPAERGLDFAADTDEGAYAFSAQLLLAGELPYRDFFATLPPLALYLFAGVQAPFARPWGSLAGFMALRYASVAYGLATILAVYGIGRRLGGRAAGLLAAALLAGDGIVAAQDRRAMLEAPMNLLSALAVLAYLRGMEQARGGKWPALAGALSAAAVMVKSPASVVPLVLVGMTLARRRWAELWPLLAGGVGTGLLLAGPFLWLCPDAFLKQVYAFQMARPPDGLQGAGARLRDIWNQPAAWLTVRAGLLGAAIGLWGLWRKPARAGWLLIAAWAGGTALLLLSSPSYWTTYFAPLAPPLAILGGGLLAGAGDAASPGVVRSPLWRFAPAALVLAFAVWAGLHLPVQAAGVRRQLSFSKPAFGEVMRYLRARADDGAVLATDPLYAMVASRPQARGAGRPWMPDSYGGMLYRNSGLADKSWAEVWRMRGSGGDLAQTERLFALQPAQSDVLAAFEEAGYVVVDRRARRQWTPATLGEIEARSVEVLRVDDVSLRERE